MLTASDIDIAARTVWGEARNQSYNGMLAVAHVLKNRWNAKHRGEITLAGVCTEPYQFSCWLPGDPNRNKLFDVEVT